MKLYTQKAILLATFIGGPLAAGFLIKKNFDNEGNIKKGNIAFIISILTTLIIFIVIFLIPSMIIGSLVPFLTLATFGIIEVTQGDLLKHHKENNGLFYSIWRAIGIGIVSMLIIGSAIYGLISYTNLGTDYDAIAYEKGHSEFLKNDQTSLKIINESFYGTQEEMLNKVAESISLCQKNIEIVRDISSIENLPEEIVNYNDYLKQYLELRMEYFELIYKAVLEDTIIYDEKINKIGLEIEELIRINEE